MKKNEKTMNANNNRKHNNDDNDNKNNIQDMLNHQKIKRQKDTEKYWMILHHNKLKDTNYEVLSNGKRTFLQEDRTTNQI